MKVRQDFVTNSSSSSYIIAYQRTPNYDEETLKKYPALSCFNRLVDMVLTASSDYNETNKGKKITNKDELDDYFVKQYGWTGQTLDDIFSEDKWCKEQYDKCLSAIQYGYVVIFKSIDHCDNTISNLIEELSDSKVGVKIINCDG